MIRPGGMIGEIVGMTVRNLRHRAVAGAALALACVLGAAQVSLRAQDNPGNKTDVAVSAEGREVYEQICQACHMADAKGGAGAGTGVPALAANPKLADRGYGIGIVRNGRGGMPRFGAMLTPAQIAAVLTYVRGHFNAFPDPVSEAEVANFTSAALPTPECNSCGH